MGSEKFTYKFVSLKVPPLLQHLVEALNSIEDPLEKKKYFDGFLADVDRIREKAKAYAASNNTSYDDALRHVMEEEGSDGSQHTKN